MRILLLILLPLSTLMTRLSYSETEQLIDEILSLPDVPFLGPTGPYLHLVAADFERDYVMFCEMDHFWSMVVSLYQLLY